MIKRPKQNKAEWLRRCHENLLDFTRVMFRARTGQSFIVSDHHKKICAALEDVYRGNIKRLIIAMPPRASKTELAIVNFIPWCLGHATDCEFITASYSAALAIGNSYNARALMQHPVYAQVFGSPAFKEDSAAKNYWRTKQGGSVYACGNEGSLTGFGAGKFRDSFGGCLILDDPLKPTDSNSKVMRDNLIQWYSQTLESRRNSPDTPIVLIAQRLHVNDLAGYLLGGGSNEKWQTVIIPALDEDDKSFWEARFPAEDLIRMRQADPARFASQYQQTPTIRGGNLIRSSWFPRYSVLPSLLEWRAIYADTAMKTTEANDYSVFECWGLKAGSIYLIDMIRGRWDAVELERRAIAFWNKHQAQDQVVNGSLRQMAVEDKASGTGLIQALKIKTGIPIQGIERTKDKYTRVCDVLGYMESGRVFIPESAPFVSDFLSECEAFTADDSHDFDDQIDPMIDAIKDMLTSQNIVQMFERMF